MPGNLDQANPADVMPKGLCAQFTEELRIESFINQSYPDGSSDRVALVTNARHFFRLTRPVRGSDYTDLYTFYKGHLVKAFYFYNLRESGWQWDQSGQSTAGRYTVVFDGNWADQLGVGRTGVSLGLREVA